jgi:hypothetical protein
MNIELPGVNPVQGFQTGVMADPSAASAPWRATAQVGAQISAIGEKAADTMLRLQRAKNVKMANDAEIAINETWANFRTNLLKNHNPEEWPSLWEKQLGELKKTYVPDNLAPEQQALIGQRFADFSSRTSSDLLRDSTVAGIGQAKQSYANLITQRINAGDKAGAVDGVNQMVNDGLIDLPTAEAQIIEIDGQFSTREALDAAKDDPYGTLDRLDEKNADGTFTHYGNLPPRARDAVREEAQQAAKYGSFSMIDTFMNGVATGDISRPDQIDSRPEFAKASPALKKKLKDSLAQELTQQQRDYMKTPAYADEVVGRVNSMLSNYVPDRGFDETLFDMTALAASLPPGKDREKLETQIKQKREGVLEEWDSAAAPYRDMILNFAKGGGFGYGSKRKSVQQVLDDGLFADPGNLSAVGYTPEQIKAITAYSKTGEELEKADEERPTAAELKALGLPEATAAIAAKVGGQDAQKIIAKELWNKRRAADENLDQGLLQSFETVLSGQEGFVEWPDPEAQLDVDKKTGAALREFDGWLRITKEPNDEKLRGVVEHILGPEGQTLFDGTFGLPDPNEDLLLGPKR